jgi:integrase
MRIEVDEFYAESVRVGIIGPWSVEGLRPWAKPAPSTPSPTLGVKGIPAPPRTGTPLDEAIEQWGEFLIGRARKHTSAQTMRNKLRRAAARMGWATTDDLTFEAVEGYLATRTDWSAATNNQHRSCFRNFGKWLARTKQWELNHLEHIDDIRQAAGVGARAASTDEALAIIRYTAGRNNDKRSLGCRSLYYAALFLAGCRRSEPAAWQWRDLQLEEEPAVIIWRPEVHKNGQRVELVLAPELAGLLRQWRDHLRDLGEPTAGEALVFDVPPSATTWRQDRERAGIAEVDSRGRGMSPHSARKWFATTLTVAGVPTRMVDRLMRHAGRTEHRYFDPSREEQVLALQALPRIWPVGVALASVLTDKAATRGVIRRNPAAAGL